MIQSSCKHPDYKNKNYKHSVSLNVNVVASFLSNSCLILATESGYADYVHQRSVTSLLRPRLTTLTVRLAPPLKKLVGPAAVICSFAVQRLPLDKSAYICHESAIFSSKWGGAVPPSVHRYHCQSTQDLQFSIRLQSLLHQAVAVPSNSANPPFPPILKRLMDIADKRPIARDEKMVAAYSSLTVARYFLHHAAVPASREMWSNMMKAAWSWADGNLEDTSIQSCAESLVKCKDYTGDPLVEIDILLALANNLELHEESMPGPGLQSLRDRAAIYRQHLITAMSSTGREEPTQCAVCLEDIDARQATRVSGGYNPRLVILPCCHMLDHGCAVKWNADHDDCPTC
ncbi:TPA: hypothetical protein ACH3X1_015697 [Trebouxia sp. C0004]